MVLRNKQKTIAMSSVCSS